MTAISSRYFAKFLISTLFVLACTQNPNEIPQKHKASKLLSDTQNPNDISPENKAPKLLFDEKEMESYLQAFPKDEYRVVYNPNHGKFYLEKYINDAIKNDLGQGNAWEPQVTKVLLKYIKEGTTVIDAGAHVGTHTMTMAKAVGKQGRVYAFEPQKKIFRELVYNMQLNKLKNVIPLRFALGDKPDVISMEPSRQHNEGGTSIGEGGDKAELRTVDSFHFSNVSLIKIDVEHYERFVLQGARETIKSQHPVLVIEIFGGISTDALTDEQRRLFMELLFNLWSLEYSIFRLDFHDYLAVPAKMIQ